MLTVFLYIFLICLAMTAGSRLILGLVYRFVFLSISFSIFSIFYALQFFSRFTDGISIYSSEPKGVSCVDLSDASGVKTYVLVRKGRLW